MFQYSIIVMIDFSPFIILGIGPTAKQLMNIVQYIVTRKHEKKIESKITKRKYKYRQQFRLTFAQVYKTVWIF